MGDDPTDDTPAPGAPGAGRGPGEDDGHDEGGLELARSIARALAGKTPARRRTSLGRPRRRTTEPRASGAHPDDRDPQLLDRTLGAFVTDQGWGTELRVHGVFSRWSAIVGDEVGAHVTPESYAEGRLVCRADSTAWATQLKLLAGDVVRRLNEELGEGTVTVIDVLGPHAPSWSRGRLRVKGRGPRDTYG